MILNLFLIPAAGYLLLALAGRRWIGDLLGTGLALGAGSVGTALFSLQAAGLSAGAAAGVAAGALAILAALLRVRRRLGPPAVALGTGGEAAGGRFAVGGALAAAGIGLGIVALHALRSPVLEWDAVAIWALKAKVLAAGGLGGDYFHSGALSYSHPDYPLLVPVLVAALPWSGREPGPLFPLLYAALTVLLYSESRRHLDPARAAALAVVGVSFPVMVRWAGSGYADVPLTLFYAAGLAHLLRWADAGRRSDLLLSAAFSAFMGFTKNEGLALAALNVLAIGWLTAGGAARRLRAAAAYSAPLLLLLLPWLLFRSGIPSTHENYLARLRPDILLEGLDRIGPVLGALLVSLLDPRAWGGLWPLLAAAAVLGWRAARERTVRALWALLLGHLAAYAVAYLVTPWEPSELLPISLDRLILHATPAAVLLIARHGAGSRSFVAPAPREAGGRA